jgi:hypothetical protein
MNENEKACIRALRKKGLTYAETAAELGLSVNTVKSYCRRNGEKKKLCRNCGYPLTQISGHKPKTFCSDQCRSLWWKGHRDQMRRRTGERVICAGCGQPFDSYGHENRKYCCHPCYIRHRFGVP